MWVVVTIMPERILVRCGKTMKLQRFKRYLLVLLLLGFCGSGWATLYPLPDPLPPLPPGVTVGADIDGTGLFDPFNSVLNIEIFDFAEQITSGRFGTQFGFYYGSDPSTLIPIFDSGDNTFESASVNFGSGIITDPNDIFDVLTFTPQAGSIGFYTTAPFVGTRFTQASENGGVDFSAAYPVFGTLPNGTPLIDAYLIGFTITPGVISPLYASVTGPLTPSPIPLPGTFFLLLTGLAGVAQFRRRFAVDKPVAATAAR